ncbi:ck1 family protein kinase [Stylonychia lemnae]|uniref:Casein kinase I n=1 Tax=Stylonychia lemnae TaxID=5949 RepID=A0A078B1Y9_STYLE|nr:ck1 family protein kinase [Stylonychia lemnae]|eukprot:CDW88296.1 ck1 family protein kinase [Stylonychia lemnae]
MEDLQPPKLIQQYTYVKDLGFGAYGKVCLYQDRQGNEFAIKLFKESGYYKFLEEKNCLVDINARNKNRALYIPQVHYNGKYACEDKEGQKIQYLVMEFLPLSLEEFCEEKKLAHNENDVLKQIVQQMVNLMKGLHQLGYVHRDVKPDNFRVKEKLENSNEFQIYLIDFGSAKKLENGAQDPNKQQDNVGTPATSSIYTTQDLISLQGDDLISVFYSVMIMVEPQNIPWLEICNQVNGRPTMEQKQQIVEHKKNIGQQMFVNKYLMILAKQVLMIEKFRKNDIRSYCENLPYDSICQAIFQSFVQPQNLIVKIQSKDNDGYGDPERNPVYSIQYKKVEDKQSGKKFSWIFKYAIYFGIAFGVCGIFYYFYKNRQFIQIIKTNQEPTLETFTPKNSDAQNGQI